MCKHVFTKLCVYMLRTREMLFTYLLIGLSLFIVEIVDNSSRCQVAARNVTFPQHIL